MRIFRERKPGRTFMHDLGTLFILIYVVPIAIAVFSVDIAFWQKTIPQLCTGHYFGRLNWLDSSGDLLLEAFFLVLGTLPIVLPLLWLLLRARRSIRQWRSQAGAGI